MAQLSRKAALISRTISILLFSVLFSMATHAAPLADFTAHYTIGDKSPAGNRVLTFSQTNNQYTLSAKTEATGLYALLSPAPITEESKGILVGQQVIPAHYLRNNNNDPDKNLDLSFDWPHKLIISKDAAKTIQYAISAQAQDFLSETLSLMLDPPGKTARKLDLVTYKRPKFYSIEHVADETITTPAGTFETGKYKRSRIGSKGDHVFIWCAPKLHNLPVKIESFKKGKSHIAVLNSIKGL
jgi:hypothetical protein